MDTLLESNLSSPYSLQAMDEPAPRLNGLEKAVVQILMSRGVLPDAELKATIANLLPDFQDAPPIHDQTASLQEMLKNINDSVDPYGLCVRTVVMDEPLDNSAGSDTDTDDEDEVANVTATGDADVDANGDTDAVTSTQNNNPRTKAKNRKKTNKVLYHGLANLEEDFVAKEFGAMHHYQPKEVLLFNHLLQKLIRIGRENNRLGQININEANTVSKDAELGLSGVQISSTVERLEQAGWLTRDNYRGYIQIGIRSYLELQPVLEAAHAAVDGDAGIHDDEAAKSATRAFLPQVIMY